MGFTLFITQRNQSENGVINPLIGVFRKRSCLGRFPSGGNAHFIFKFENDAFGGFFPDAVNARDGCDIRTHDRVLKIGNAHAAQDGKSDFWPHTRDVIDEKSKQVSLGTGQKTVENVSVFAHDELGQQVDLTAHWGQFIESGKGDQGEVTNARDIYCYLGGQSFREFSFNKSDHGKAAFKMNDVANLRIQPASESGKSFEMSSQTHIAPQKKLSARIFNWRTNDKRCFVGGPTPIKRRLLPAATLKNKLFRVDCPMNKLISSRVLIAGALAVSAISANAETEAFSAAPLLSGGSGYSEFVPSENPGSGNFERRPVRFTFSVNQGYDDNIYTSNIDKQESAFTSASINALLSLSNGRTSLDGGISLGAIYYWDREGDDLDPDIVWSLDFGHVFSPKLRLDISSSFSYQSNPDFAAGGVRTQRSGNYVNANLGFNLTQTFTRRFSAVYSYSVGGVYYDDSLIGDTDNRLEQTLGLQLRFLIQPTISLVGEYRFGFITYDTANRDSISHYILGGVDFTINRRLTASLRLGAQLRDSDDRGEETSPFVESTLTYQYGERSRLSWINRYGYEESDFGFGTTRQTYRTGLSVSHQFTSRIAGNLGAYYTNSTYEGLNNDDEQTLDLTVGATYSVNRLLSFQVGYTYTEVFSEDAFREYDRNRIFAGATFSF